MSAFGKIVKGRAATRCDGCGRISRDLYGYYFDRTLQLGGTISSKGRECEHDFCSQCEEKNSEQCPKCAAYKEQHAKK